MLISLGERSLEARVVGDGPVVVFENGAGSPSFVWWKVVEELKSDFRCLTYNRAGIGVSDAGPPPRDAEAVARDLQALLDVLEVDAPVVLVAHSLGALFARLFYARYPHRVAAMVLVDPSHPDVYDEVMTPLIRLLGKGLNVGTSLFDAVGLVSGIARRQSSKNDPTDSEYLALRSAHWRGRNVLRGSRAESRSLRASCNQVRTLGDLGDLPLVVVSAGEARGTMKRIWPAWQKYQAASAALSTNGRQVIGEKSGHFVQDEQPDVVIEAIRDVADLGRF